MEFWFWYLVSVNALIALGYGVFQLFFRKDTRFRTNRYILLWIIFTSVLIPLLPVFQWWPDPVVESIRPEPGDSELFTVRINDLPEGVDPTLLIQPVVQGLEETEARIAFWGLTMYIGITALLLFRFGMQLLSLLLLIRSMLVVRQQDHVLLHTAQEIAPFSFFNFIALNPQLYDEAQRACILQHELVHVRQRHHYDIFLSELLCVLCWFNPLVWRLRSTIRQNLEYLADAEVLRADMDRKEYQYNLLSLYLPGNYQAELANHFNKSLLKKRIIMMNLKQSADRLAAKHLLLLPLFLGMVLLSMPMQAQQEKETKGEEIEQLADKYEGEDFAEAPLLAGEKVFGVVRNKLKRESLEAMQVEFERRGVGFTYSNLEYGEDGQLLRIRVSLQQWNQDVQTQTLYNGGKPITGQLVAFFFHDPEEKTAAIGLSTEVPTEYGNIPQKFVDKFAGIAILSPGGDLFAKGSLNLGEGIDAELGLKATKGE